MTIGNPALEAFADLRHGLGEEIVEACAYLGQALTTVRITQQARQPFLLGFPRHESPVHDGQLDPSDEHDLSPCPPQPLSPLRAVGEQREDLAGGQFEGAG